MRDTFLEVVEAGRNLSGVLASSRGDRHGSFFIRCPATGERLKIVASDGSDWKEAFSATAAEMESWEHVSISCERRCPWWEEMCFVKSLFWGPEECVIQFHPPKKDYVNCHPYVLHLWKPTLSAIPMPPIGAV